VFGVLLGVLFAVRDTNLSAVAALPDDAIALVNGKPIREEEYENALALLAGDKRDALTDEDRAHVLTRLIEEELLVQRGIADGLVDVNRAVRKTIATAMLDAILAESSSEQPTEEELRNFYERYRSRFYEPMREEGSAKEVAFEEMRGRVESAYLQQRRDDALREYIGWLRSEAKIVVAPPFSFIRAGQDARDRQ
jgi:hypothetical protein